MRFDRGKKIMTRIPKEDIFLSKEISDNEIIVCTKPVNNSADVDIYRNDMLVFYQRGLMIFGVKDVKTQAQILLKMAENMYKKR